jgi:spore maturation protein CgeB
VLVYRNQHELLDKIRFYLAHPAQAEMIRQAGRKRALAEHTYHERYRKLFKALGLL